VSGKLGATPSRMVPMLLEHPIEDWIKFILVCVAVLGTVLFGSAVGHRRNIFFGDRL